MADMIVTNLAVIQTNIVYLTNGIQAVDILKEVHSYYNDAWEKLLYLITIGGAVVGIIVPLLMALYQRDRFKDLQEELRKQANRVNDAERNMTEEANRFTKARDEAETRLQKLEAKSERILKIANAMGMSMQARFFLLTAQAFNDPQRSPPSLNRDADPQREAKRLKELKEWDALNQSKVVAIRHALRCLIEATKGFVTLGEKNNAEECLKDLRNVVVAINAPTLKNDPELLWALKEFLDQLGSKKTNISDTFQSCIVEIRDALNNLDSQ